MNAAAPWALVALAVGCNALAQLALKQAGQAGLARWQDWLSWPLLLGAGLYGLSFLLTVKVYAHFPLSLISPLMAGAIFVLITLGAALCFHEPIGSLKLLGLGLIAAGIACLSQSA